jgi:hypothetical protein
LPPADPAFGRARFQSVTARRPVAGAKAAQTNMLLARNRRARKLVPGPPSLPCHFASRYAFARHPDGVRIAFATMGRGDPLVKVGNWLSHLEFDLGSPVWGHMLEALSSRHMLLRYDQRGTGLSDREVRS